MDDRSFRNDPERLDHLVEATAQCFAAFCAISADCFVTKNRLGTMHVDQTLEPSTRCTACGALLYRDVRVLCGVCRGQALSIRKGRPFVDVVWSGINAVRFFETAEIKNIISTEMIYSLSQSYFCFPRILSGSHRLSSTRSNSTSTAVKTPKSQTCH